MVASSFSHRLSADRLPAAQATRSPPRRGDGSLRAARRSRAGARPARPRPHRHHAGLRAVRPARLKQAVGFYEGKADEINGTFNSVFKELLKVPHTRRKT